MATLTHRTEVQLAREELLALDDIRGTRLRCLEGSVWITLHRDPRDIVLEAGDGFTVDRRGVTLVHALEPARVSVEDSYDTAALTRPRGWSALGRLGRRLQAALSSPMPAGA